MPAAGLEPALCHHKQILSLPRLPFRHAGFHNNDDSTILLIQMQVKNAFSQQILVDSLLCNDFSTMIKKAKKE